MPRSNSYKNINYNKKYSTVSPSSELYNKNITPSYTSYQPNGFLQTMKEGFALGAGSSAGQLITYSVLGGPKVTVEHTYINQNNVTSCVNTTKNNCSDILLEYEKCKGDYNCDFEKLDKLKNDYDKCTNDQLKQ
jgi:hypothetical protein